MQTDVHPVTWLKRYAEKRSLFFREECRVFDYGGSVGYTIRISDRLAFHVQGAAVKLRTNKTIDYLNIPLATKINLRNRVAKRLMEKIRHAA